MGLFLVPADPFQSFQLRSHLRDLTLHAVKLRLLDMLAMSSSNLFWSEGKSLSVPRNACTRVELNQNSTNCISTPHKKCCADNANQSIKKCCFGGFGFQRLLYYGEHVFKTNPPQVPFLRLSFNSAWVPFGPLILFTTASTSAFIFSFICKNFTARPASDGATFTREPLPSKR